ncbi:MAG: hypothetical protein KGI51_12600, partial [Rhodospirillales bacterium]|nr:hypothetical protein [Rhodospirillales bacterium]
MAEETGAARRFLEETLRDPELRAWLDSDWRLWPILRPVCHMLGVQPGLVPPPEPHLRWPPRLRPRRRPGRRGPAAPVERESTPQLRGFEALILPVTEILAKRLAAIEAKAKAEASPPPSAIPPMRYVPAPGEVRPPPIDWNARDLLTEIKNSGRKKPW